MSIYKYLYRTAGDTRVRIVKETPNGFVHTIEGDCSTFTNHRGAPLFAPDADGKVDIITNEYDILHIKVEDNTLVFVIGNTTPRFNK